MVAKETTFMVAKEPTCQDPTCAKKGKNLIHSETSKKAKIHAIVKELQAPESILQC